MDFEILAPGHGVLGSKQDALDHGEYLRELHSKVKLGIDEGRSLEDLQHSLTLEKYKDWGRYDDWRSENIQGMHGYLAN